MGSGGSGVRADEWFATERHLLDDAEGEPWVHVRRVLWTALSVGEPLVAHHVKRRVVAALWLGVGSVVTCGVGLVVLWPSFWRWYADAERAAGAGRAVRPW